MTELVSAWIYSGKQWDEFQRRAKFYLLPGTQIYSNLDRVNLKEFWYKEWMVLKKKHEKMDPAIMSKFDARERIEIDALGAILNNLQTLTEQIADHLHASNFESFCDDWLADLDRDQLAGSTAS